jgi:hypothetical protein
MTLSLVLPIRTVSEANQRSCWQARARRAKQQRAIAGMALRPKLRGIRLPLVVTIERHAPSAGLDYDGLVISNKAVVDGIADALGCDDRDPGITWKYTQKRSPRGCYWLSITLEARHGASEP